MRAKQRVYTVAILLAALATLVPVTFVIVDRDPYLAVHLALNLPLLGLCVVGVGLLRAGRVAIVERLMLAAVVVYILAWDVVNLAIGRMPSSSEVVSNAPVFLLGCILLCLILPIRSQRSGLLGFTGVHLGLTWVNLLRFPWGSAQVGQLTTDVITIVSVLLLSLIGLYQLQLLRAQDRVNDLHEQATTDPLTGLLNRRALYPVLERSEPMAVALIDLDDFKAVNDAYGHLQGDAELVAVAGALRQLTAGKGMVARWGGEEFLVVLPRFDREMAVDWAESTRRYVQDLPEATTTLSVGVTVAREQETVARLLSRADDLLYAAKHAGKNRVVTDPNPPSPGPGDS